MTTRFSNISNIIPNFIRFQPIDPDTLIYSNDEEDEEHIKVISEKISHDSQLKTSSNSGSTSENRATKSQRVKQVSRKIAIPINAKNRQENSVLAGKDLDSVSPLIKRLLIDTYENHKKEEQLIRIHGSRRRKSNNLGYDNGLISISSVNKWRSNLNRETSRNTWKQVRRSVRERKDDTGRAHKSFSSSSGIVRNRSSAKQDRINQQTSQSREKHVAAGCSKPETSLVLRKVLNLS